MCVALVITFVGISEPALAGSGVGGNLKLGKTNRVNAQTSLLGSSSKSLLHIANTAQGSTTGALGAVSNGGGATVSVMGAPPWARLSTWRRSKRRSPRPTRPWRLSLSPSVDA
jgi:hypothetical protein